jgi:hypothetical protein
MSNNKHHPYKGLKLSQERAEGILGECQKQAEKPIKGLTAPASPGELWTLELQEKGISFLETLYWMRRIFNNSEEVQDAIYHRLGPKDGQREKELLGLEDQS